MRTKNAQQAGKRIRKEIEILKKSEKAEIQDQGHGEQRLAVNGIGGSRNLARQEIIDYGREHHEQQESPVPPTVEEVARQ